MSLPAQNLHEFVLNLLNDEAARSAFAADPTSALAAAGLSDVTPQDIQEVAPLVADYAPAPLADALSALPLDADVTDLQGAIAQLQAVADAADALPVATPELPLDVPARADLPVETPALPVDTSALPLGEELLGGPTADLGDLPVELPELGDLPLGDLPLNVPALDGLPLDARNDLPVGDLPVGDLPVNTLPVEAPDLSSSAVSLPEVEGLQNAVPGLPVELPALGELPSLPTVSTERADVPSELTGLPVDASALPVDASALPVDASALPLDAGALPVGTEDVTGLAAAVGLTELPETGGLPVDFDTLGSLPVDAPSLGDEPFTAPDLDVPGVGRFDTTSAGSADGYATTVSYEGDLAEGAAAAAAAAEGAGVAGTAGTPAGAFIGSAAGSTEGFTGGFAVENNEGELQGGLTATEDAVLAGARTDSALGTYTLGVDGTPADAPSLDGLPSFDEAGDLAGSLDSDVLGRAEPAAGTIADYISIGGDLVGGGVAQHSATLGEYLTLGGAQAGELVTNGGAQAGTAISDAGHQAADLASDLPAAPGVPSVLPAAVPTTIPAEAPGDLPVHFGAELPQGLPQLPVANPLPEVTNHVEHALTTDPVKEIVSVTDSPLADAIGPLNHAPLPEAADLDNLHGDLPLGH
ncbi:MULTISPECIES: IniB N-terminal domain-containing protein [Amycolatopsis]|uniref:IniB N-terminal domain-containing protein n=1 Tax=Amycolatopsis TaxID=1813 RepID=UPI000B8AF7BC|nr:MULTISPECIES: IniB N-terminal domain-containing protein [Amycolatopsis]OXM74258.1 hypothetical protein CF166_05600 [Amycolatopsis sp. KNN50.9b]